VNDEIVRKKVMGPRKLKAPSVLGRALLWGAGVYFAPILLMGLSGSGGGAFLWGFFGWLPALGVTVFVLTWRHARAPLAEIPFLAELSRDARARMIEFIGSEPKYVDTCGTAIKEMPGYGTGSGMAVQGDRIFIMENGEIAAVPFSRIRSWTWEIQGRSKIAILGAGPGDHRASMQAIEMNRAASREAALSSGFFLSIADVDKPVWRFGSGDQKVLERWDEILTQLREGLLKAG